MPKYNISFPYVTTNKYLINLFGGKICVYFSLCSLEAIFRNIQKIYVHAEDVKKRYSE